MRELGWTAVKARGLTPGGFTRPGKGLCQNKSRRRHAVGVGANLPHRTITKKNQSRHAATPPRKIVLRVTIRGNGSISIMFEARSVGCRATAPDLQRLRSQHYTI